MNKLAASLAVLAVTAGLALAGGGIALADDDHSDNSRHPAYGSCSQPHSVNVANCANVLDLGRIGPIL
jgi:hypothetical protein